MKTILVTGATGQIGSELVPALRAEYGSDRVIAAGYSRDPAIAQPESGPSARIDVRDAGALETLVADHAVDTIFHLAALLSAVAESGPQQAWDVNMNGLLNVLEVARGHDCSVFFPSSIGAFGPGTPPLNTPQDTIQRPNTMYGVTKVSGELLCDYYCTRFGVDVRGVRYPGLISWKSLPGGGTTDYAVDIFYAALKTGTYSCFLRADTQLDMMYMPDAIAAAIGLMQADRKKLRHHNAFNVTAMSFTPEELAAEIGRHIPGFTITYEVDPVRQAIADSWPRHMDDSAAQREWGWQPRYGLQQLVPDMLKHLADKLAIEY